MYKKLVDEADMVERGDLEWIPLCVRFTIGEITCIDGSPDNLSGEPVLRFLVCNICTSLQQMDLCLLAFPKPRLSLSVLT